MTTSIATSGTNSKGWQRVTTSGTTSDKEWQRSDTTSDNEGQQVVMSDSSGTTNENGTVTSKNEWLPSFQWQK